MSETGIRAVTSPVGGAESPRRAADAVATGTRSRARFAGLRGGLLVLGSVVVMVLLWDRAIAWLDIPSYILPTPATVWTALLEGVTEPVTSRTSFVYHAGATMEAVVLGFALGSVLGLVLAGLAGEFAIIRKLLSPYVIAFQSLPKIAIAPLILIWFGYGLPSKAVIAAVLAFFPVFVNTLSALATVDGDRLQLMRALRASRWETFRKVKIPSCATPVFAALDLAVVYALLGGVVAEFIGSQSGLGVLLLQRQAVADTAGVFSTLIVMAVLGFTLHGIVRLVERRVVFWARTDE